MAKKLFVGNLPFSMSQQQLTDIFAQYGNIISANIVADKFSGRSKGFGFVEFEKDEDAMKAIEGLNETEQMGRNIAVKEAIAREEQPVSQPVETPVVKDDVAEDTMSEVPIIEDIVTEEPVVEEPTV